ncbi:MAG: kynureninase [Desulfatiglandaceae bacterium]
MDFSNTHISLAHELDARDELSSFRHDFVIADPGLIYLDGNSLGRLPKRTIPAIRNAVEKEWGERLIRAWNDGWVNAPTELGAKIARLVGAKPNEIVVTDATSINLFKLAVAALQARPGRNEIVSDVFNFPSDLYVLQGVIELLENMHHLKLIPSKDSITISSEAIDGAIDDCTALVSLTHVAFKSAFMYDMARITEAAHRAGAVMLWDLSHSAGAVPVDLNGCGVDLAVGCTYKYLNGGPGSPAFLYVREDLQKQMTQPMWGWFAAEKPFAFELDFNPASDISRYRVGTPPMISMKAVEPALDLLLEAGMERIRAKSIMQTEYLIFLADQWLTPLGFTVSTPRRAEQRGSHVSLRHADAYRINRAMIESPPPARKVIPDFRAPDFIRLGIAPLYTTFVEIHQALDRMRTIVRDKIYEQYSTEQLAVT